jgi:hypothetical protein
MALRSARIDAKAFSFRPKAVAANTRKRVPMIEDAIRAC